MTSDHCGALTRPTTASANLVNGNGSQSGPPGSWPGSANVPVSNPVPNGPFKPRRLYIVRNHLNVVLMIYRFVRHMRVENVDWPLKMQIQIPLLGFWCPVNDN